MPRRQPPGSVDISALPLVGERVCLSFVNTANRRETSASEEALTRYADLVAWARRSWLLGSGAERELQVEDRLRPGPAAAVLDFALGVRESLYRLILALIDSRPPDASDLAAINDWIGAAAGRRRLVATARGLRWRWTAGAAELDRMLWPVAQSAADLLTSDDLGRVRRCGDCDRLFLDTTKNGSRRWCRKQCGDRVKARRYYRRVQRA